MVATGRKKRLLKLLRALPHASDAILWWIERVVEKLARPASSRRDPKSNLISDKFLADLGDALRLHHCFSEEPLTKDKFEYAMNVVAKACGHKSALAGKTNPGHDITIDGTPFSLKTQADKKIRTEKIHISKFMELGKGAWTANVKDLHGLRDQFLRHTRTYERILILRCLLPEGPTRHYELVEIPKSLLERSKAGVFSISRRSKQTPPCGECRVSGDGALLFVLYFDGGTERKLQIKHLAKSACVVHAEWRFDL